MKRKIIQINEELCNGCGNCITGCSEGALQLVNGKARLVKENFCDGFGDCIGTCPTGALTIEEREADHFDLDAVKAHLFATQGIEAVWRMEEAQKRHDELASEPHQHIGCPGAISRMFESPAVVVEENVADTISLQSELRQWPVHFRLINPQAPFFKNKELVLMSTCGPLAMADIHRHYLRDRSVIVGCPKLDDTSTYIPKLAAILKLNPIPKVIIARMEVPCCGGLTRIAMAAVQASERTDLVLEENIIGTDGNIKDIQVIS